MAKKRVYVETSVFSWLTAKPPNDILKLAKQRQTQIWWEHRHRWELFISPVVVREIRDGDSEAARKRLIPISFNFVRYAQAFFAFVKPMPVA